MPKLRKQINKKMLKYGLFFVLSFIILNLSYTENSLARKDDYSRETPVVKAVREISPAVVNISSEIEVRVSPFAGFGDPFFDSFFKDFFDPGFDRRYKRSSLGSGVIIDGERGFILTNAHVIAKAGKITVVLNDEREFEAQVVGADPDSDLAVLRITSDKPLPSVSMGDSGELMIGETVIAIGNPFGFSNTVTTGVISAANRSFRTEDRVYHDFIQTDASINPGNSGGPLLNINGELIGINTAIYAKAQGIGFAIPINKAKRIVSDLIQYGEVVQGWIGIIVQSLDAKLAQYMGVPENKGVLVKATEPSSPARKAGIRDGDILLSVNNKAVYSSEDYRAMVRSFAVGDVIQMQIWRDGKKKTISMTAEIFPRELARELAYELLGIKVKDVSSGENFRYIAKEGVVITEIRKQCYLARIGVMPGDVIRQIDEFPVRSVQDFEDAMIKYREKNSVVILLQRGDRGYYITVNL